MPCTAVEPSGTSAWPSSCGGRADELLLPLLLGVAGCSSYTRKRMARLLGLTATASSGGRPAGVATHVATACLQCSRGAAVAEG